MKQIYVIPAIVNGLSDWQSESLIEKTPEEIKQYILDHLVIEVTDNPYMNMPLNTKFIELQLR